MTADDDGTPTAANDTSALTSRLAAHGVRPATLIGVVAAIVVATVPVAPPPARTWLTWLLFAVVHVSFCRDAWAVFRSPDASRTTRRLWLAFFVAVALFLLGDLVQLTILATQPWSYEVAVGSDAQAVLLLAGMAVVVGAAAALPMRFSSTRATVRFTLDLGNVSIGVVALMVAVQPVSDANGGLALLDALLGPVLFALATVAIAKLLLARDRPFTTTAGRILAVAALGEALLATVTLRPDLAQNLVLINGVALTSNALLALAARAQRHAPGHESPPKARRRPRLAVLPYVAVVVTNVLFITTVSAEGMTVRGWVMLAATVAATVLVLIRQMVTLTEQTALVQQLHAALDERNELTGQLAHLAYHDPLTGLANRAHFEAMLETAVEECIAATDDPGHKHLGVVLVDLDGFKAVNDTYGHDAGDQALVAVADRIRTCVRTEDLVARFGGDEFYVVLPGGADDAEAVAERIVVALSEPIDVAGQVVQIGASAGVAFAGRPGWNSGELLRRADAAMYTAKTQGKNRVVVDVD